jgi:hypothetical protein
VRAKLQSRPPIERVREILVYEEGSGRLIWRVTSGRAIAGNEAGGVEPTIGYRRVRFLGNILMTHHVVFAIVHGRWPQQLDHIDGDKLNNRIQNLRECDQSHNMANQGLSMVNKSGRKGVSRHPCGKWQVMLGKKYIGLADTVEEGAAMYEAAAIERYGDFARGENFKAPAQRVVSEKRPDRRPTAEELRELLSYDEDTGDVRWKKALGFRGQVGDVAGRLTHDGYRRLGLFGKQYFTHVIIWAIKTGEWPTFVIHHVDANRSNNAWSNLAHVTQSENIQAIHTSFPTLHWQNPSVVK